MLIRLSEIFKVSSDYLLGLEATPQLNLDGLPVDLVAHLILLIDDYKAIAAADQTSGQGPKP